MNVNEETAFGTDKRAVGYIRVSDDSQIDGYSLDAQQEEIERWCQRKGYRLIKAYVEAGVTAHSDRIEKRPQLVQLLQDAENREFGIVLVHSLCRWARRLRIQIQALDRLARARVDFTSVTEAFDSTTIQGRLMLNQMGSFNEYFSDQLGQHVRKAFRLIVESGLLIGPVSFAYVRQEKGLPALVIAQEAEAVHEAFRRRDEGQSYGQIAAWMNAQGFYTRVGHAFTAHAVKDILNNHFYCGYVKYQGKEYHGKHEPIIPEELFQRVQARKQKRFLVRTVHGPAGLLQGMVACAHCGQGLQSDRHREKPMYRERHAHDCPTNNRALTAEIVDKQIATIVHSLDFHADWRQRMAEYAVSNHDGPDPATLREKRRRLVRAYGDGGYSDEEYKVRLAEIDRQIEQSCTVTPPAMEEAVALFSNIPILWNEATVDERRRLLRTLIEVAYVDLETRHVTKIKPTLVLRTLFGKGIGIGTDAPIDLLASGEETKDIVGVGGDGGESNSPSRRSDPEYATGIASSLISSG